MSAGAPHGGGPRLLIAAAGTGGHVMPGLAVAQLLKSRGWNVSWLGTRSGMERQLVERAGVPFHAIEFSSIRGKGAWKLIAGVPLLLRALLAALRVVRRASPQVVFTTGGYIAVPAGMAAAVLRRPLAFLNADAAPQLSLRLLLHVTRRVLCGFDGEAARLAGRRARLSGAPVRPEIAALPHPEQRFAGREGPLALLVVGGSLGARRLNEVLPQALARLAPGERPSVTHQCGRGNEESTRNAYLQAGVEARIEPFIDDIALRYAQADVVLCRAGAITVAELCAAGVASILVPLLASTTSHQGANAEYLASRDAAVHLPQSACTPEALAALLRDLTRARLARMAVLARGLGRPDATASVARELEELAAAPARAA